MFWMMKPVCLKGPPAGYTSVVSARTPTPLCLAVAAAVAQRRQQVQAVLRPSMKNSNNAWISHLQTSEAFCSLVNWHCYQIDSILSFSFHQLKGIHWCVYLRILDSRARVLVTLAGQPLQLFAADFHALRLSLFATEARVAAEPKESRHVMVVVASSYCPGRYTHVILVVVV